MLSTCYFIRKGDNADTFKIAELLLKDKENLMHKATGWVLRFAGDKYQKNCLLFYIIILRRCHLLYFGTILKKWIKGKKGLLQGLKKSTSKRIKKSISR